MANPRAATTRDTHIWPGAVVYFTIHQSLAAYRELIFEAFNEFHQNTCIQFRKCKQCIRHIRLIKSENDTDCSTALGLQRTYTPQNVFLGAHCLHLGIIVHEIAHSLGLIHEHQRQDRDDHIVIHWENITTELNVTDQFEVMLNVTTLSPFDFHAITFYANNAFAKNDSKDTITSKNSSITLLESSNKPGLSEYDIAGLNKLYNCTTLDTSRK